MSAFPVLGELIQAFWAILLESSAWVVLSLLVGGLAHEFLPTSNVRQRLNRPGISSTLGAVALGAMLPICSCGVIPLAVSLYRAGVRLGPVMAFAAATPMINPAAVVLSYALLGPSLTLAYVVLGLLLPLLLGVLCERFGDKRPSKSLPFPLSQSVTDTPLRTGSRSFAQRIGQGLQWGLFSLGPTIGYYLAAGIALAAMVSVLVPQTWMQEYLGDASLLGLLAVGLFGASIYVCAVAHIPLVATLLAAGAGPGAAVVFLVTGAATNLPELLTLYHTIGKRTVILYTTVMISASVLAGVAINAWLLPGFKPVFDPVTSLDLISATQNWQLFLPTVIYPASAFAVLGLAIWGIGQRLLRLSARTGITSLRQPKLDKRQ